MKQLVLEHIKKSYCDCKEEIVVLKDVCLSVEKGDFITVCGQSGSGKSTLLHLIGFLDKADSGQIYLNNELISVDSEKAVSIRRKQIGFIFQFHYLLEDLTALENIALPLMVGNISRTMCIEKSKELISQLRLSHRQNHFPHQLSGGEQQRVALGRALITKPEIILADEPTGNLDPEHSSDIIDLFYSLNEQNKCTFILVTHDRDIAKKSLLSYRLEDGVLISI